MVCWQIWKNVQSLGNALLNTVSSAPSCDIYQLFVIVIICDNLMNSNLPHPHVPAPRVIQRQISSFTQHDSSVTASLHQPLHSPQASLNLFSLHNCKYSLSCFSLSPCLGPLSPGTRQAFCWSKTPGNSHAVQNEPWLSPQSTCISFRNKVSYVHPDQLNIIKM